MKKRIDIIINSLRGGGAEKVCVSIANGLSENGYDVRLVVLNLINSVYDNRLNKNVKLVVLKKKRARSSSFALLKYIKKTKPKKILVFNYQLAIILLILRRIFFLKVTIISRNINTLSFLNKNNFSLKYFIDPVIKTFYKTVDLVIAQSQGMAKDLITHYGFEERKVIVINNPIDENIESFAEQHEINLTNEKRILYVGRLSYQKGLNYLIHSFKLSLKSIPDLKLTIVGDGELEEKLKNKVKVMGLSGKVEFCDFTIDIIKHYISSRVTVLTSIYEGFPNVLVESIALGVPIVAFDCPSGPSEIIVPEVNGILVNYLDVEELSRAIVTAVNKNWDSSEIKKTANRYKNKFIIDKYIEVLSNV